MSQHMKMYANSNTDGSTLSPLEIIPMDFFILITMLINLSFNKDKQYRRRSCANCNYWHSCNSGLNRPKGFVCDYGAYGCIRYKGFFGYELSKRQLRGLKKLKLWKIRNQSVMTLRCPTAD